MLVLIFCCHLLGVCVCVWGEANVSRVLQSVQRIVFWGIIDLTLLQTEGN